MLNILLIIIATLTIVIAIGVIVDFIVNAKMEHFINYVSYVINRMIEDATEESEDDQFHSGS